MNRTIASIRTARFELSREPLDHSAGAFHVAAVALLVTAVDLAACVVYWQAYGIGLGDIARSIASWVLGPNPPATAFVFATGFAVHYLVYLSMAVVFRHTLARLGNGSSGRWMAIGSGYGVMMYIAVYRVIVPTLIFPQRLNESPAWIMACVLLHGFILGPLMAWLLTDSSSHDEPGHR